MSRHVVTDFVNYNDSRLLREYFDSNQHLCGDIREEHKHRNIHFKVIKDNVVRDILVFYGQKLQLEIDKVFNTECKPWNDPRLCRWREGESMVLHGDNENGIDLMKYSAIIYLNEDYEGGEIKFEDGDLYKLSENSVIFFESGIQNRHQVLEIKKGKRYTIPLWYQ